MPALRLPPPRRTSRASVLSRAAALSLGGLLALGLAGCADDDPQVVPAAPGSGTSEPATPSGTVTTPSDATPGEPVAADLTITVDDGAGRTASHSVTCEPAGGDVPDPEGACAALASSWATAFPPVPKDQACTMIFGGPERATVSGTVAGEQVLAEFNRSNGCEIDRWQLVEQILGPVAGTDS